MSKIREPKTRENKELKDIMEKENKKPDNTVSIFGTIGKYHWQSIVFVLILFGFVLGLRIASQKLNFPESRSILNWFGLIVLGNLLITYIIMITYRHVKSQKGFEGTMGHQGQQGDKGYTQNCGVCNQEIKTMEQPFEDVAIRQPVLPDKLNIKPKGDLIPKLKKPNIKFAKGTLKLPNKVHFWQYTKMQGNRYSFSPGNHAWVGEDANDNMTSALVPEGYWVSLFQHANFEGRQQTYMSGSYDKISSYMNDRTSSIKFHEEPTNRAVLFQYANWQGVMFSATGDHPDIGWMKSRASGLFVPKGYRLLIYSEPSYLGWQKTLNSGYYINLRRIRWDTKPSVSLNDRIKSVRLQKI